MDRTPPRPGRRLVAPFAAVGVAIAALAGALTSAADTPPPAGETATPLLQQPIANLPGRTFSAAIIGFAPGARAAPHRHGEAFVYAYVLDGSVRSQLDAEPARVYRSGENWTEAPGAHHALTENPSTTEPARLLVVFVAPTGAPLKIVDPQ